MRGGLQSPLSPLAGPEGGELVRVAFTGDADGTLLYPTLMAIGFASDTFGARLDDGVTLRNRRIYVSGGSGTNTNWPAPPSFHTNMSFPLVSPKSTGALARL